MNNVMLDIETIGNKPWSVIVSIGAVIFNPKTGDISDSTFHKKINIESCMNLGLKMDASTVLWWLKQSKDAQSVFIGNDKEESISAVLSKFNEFISMSCDKSALAIMESANKYVADNYTVS